MKRRHRRNKTVILLITLFCIAAIAIGIFSYQFFLPKVKKSLTLEAGSKPPEVKEFLISKEEDAAFETDITTLNLNAPGIYPVQIRTNGKIYTSNLTIVDTKPPAAEVVNQVIPAGEKITPDRFLTKVTDATQVTTAYKSQPDFNKTGDQSLTLVLSDTSNNKTELPAVLSIIDIKNKVQIEAGSQVPNVNEYRNTTNYSLSYKTDMNKININKPGVYDIQIKADNNTVTSKLEVVDTTPPKATAVDLEIWTGETIEAKDLVKDITDVSKVTVSFKNYLNTKKAGIYNPIIQLKDTSGNISELTANLTIKEDTIAPVITGAMDKTVYIGDKISYKANVSVADNKDKEIELKVDSSAVNLRKVGSYPVIYSAEDSSGNKTQKTITVTIKEYVIDKDLLDAEATDILDNITTSSMTQKEKAYAIYKWVKGHISYTGYSDKSDWVKEANNGIKKGVGDCFTYFAVSKELLTLTGIETMDITRVGGTTRHYWSLINTGNGWYHYDSCPNVDHRESFMLTDTELAALSKKRGNNYYNYNKTLYPSTPEK